MTDDGKNRTLNYLNSRSNGLKIGCLVVSIFLACGVSFLCGLAAIFMLGQKSPLGVYLAVGVLVLILAAAVAVKYGLNLAIAISLAALGGFLLMYGLCSQFQFYM